MYAARLMNSPPEIDRIFKRKGVNVFQIMSLIKAQQWFVVVVNQFDFVDVMSELVEYLKAVIIG